MICDICLIAQISVQYNFFVYYLCVCKNMVHSNGLSRVKTAFGQYLLDLIEIFKQALDNLTGNIKAYQLNKWRVLAVSVV